MYVGFLKTEPTAASVAKLLSLADELNSFHVKGREAYWYARDRMMVLKISNSTLEKALGVPATFRNVTTVRKLAAKCPS